MNDPLPETRRGTKMEPMSLCFTSQGMLTKVEDVKGGCYELQTMWSRAVASDCCIGPNRDRHSVPKVLDQTAVRPREQSHSEEEARQSLSATAHDLFDVVDC